MRARVATWVALGALGIGGALVLPAVVPAHPADNAVDRDHDGVQDTQDNCPEATNPDQRDIDGDGAGDACDGDDDGDGAADEVDNCPALANPTQADLDGDGRGDSCDGDVDGDGFSNSTDNCPRTPNPSQEDSDTDGIGNPCDSTPQKPGGSDTTGGGGDVPGDDDSSGGDTGGGGGTGDGGGTGGGGGGGGTLTGTDPSDRVPPRASVRAGGVHDLDALTYGLPVPVRCREACAISGQLELDGTTARKLRLGPRGRPTIIGSGAARLADAGSTFVIVRLNPAVLRKLRRVRATRPRLRVTVADAVDNRKVLYRRLALRR